jgi:hypothetical protein
MAKALGIIGGLLGLISIGLFYVMPAMFSLYRIETTNTLIPALSGGVYIGGLGSVSIVLGGVAQTVFWPDVMFMLPGILVIVGGLITLIGCGGKGAIVGGIILLMGPLFFIIQMFTGMSMLASGYTQAAGLSGQNILFGSMSNAAGTVAWGIWIGGFLEIGGGVLGIIGGATN